MGHRGDRADNDRVTRANECRDQNALPAVVRPRRWRRGRRHGGVLAACRAGAGGGDDDDRRGEAPLAPLEQLLRRAACQWGRAEPAGRWAAALSGRGRAIVSDAGGWSRDVSDARRLPTSAGADVPATAGANVPAGPRAAAAQRVWRRLPCDAA